MLLKIETFGFQKNYMRCIKNDVDKILYLKKICKITRDHFLIGHVVFVLIVRNVIENEKFHFTANLCGKGKK